MSNTASRLITLILLLQRRPNQKAAELADALGVSVRSLHRYINTLDEMGIPIYSERGPYGGFSLVRGYKMPPLVFSPEEAVALYLGTSLVRELWGPLYEEAARDALAKLESVLPAEQQGEVEWARQALVATAMSRARPEPLAPFLATLRRALREQRTVRMRYQARSKSDPGPRDFDPYVLVHGWGWWYAVGYCHRRDAIRQFRVDRIHALELLEIPFERPAGFDAHAYFDAEQRANPGVEVRVRFVPAAAHIVRYNRSYWHALEEQADGSVVVTIQTPDLEWAASTVLAYGPQVVVEAPAQLRDMVIARAAGILDGYR